jgi:shikimate kinase
MTVRCVLTGGPGAGKTTVGTALAAALGLAFRDTDADVESHAGMSVADIFLREGEEHFRELEAAAVRSALAEHDGVLALGGGAILSPLTRALLVANPGRVVWLEVGLTAALDRVGLAKARPVLAMNPRARLSQLLAERAPLYAEVAELRVLTDGRDVAEIVTEIVKDLGGERA